MRARIRRLWQRYITAVSLVSHIIARYRPEAMNKGNSDMNEETPAPVPETYKRGQVEWSLWRFATFLRDPGDKPPKAFLTRIKRLLEIDRADREEGEAFAFIADAPQGQGVDVVFTGFDAFCLALALDLLDAGFKQAEVVFLMRHIREDLKREYAWIMSDPPLARQRVGAKHVPDRPSYEDGGRRWADYRVFAVIQKVEMTEVFPVLAEPRYSGKPTILEPVFCRGIEALQADLNRRADSFRKAMVLEIANAAALVTSFLDEAPITKRGRG